MLRAHFGKHHLLRGKTLSLEGLSLEGETITHFGKHHLFRGKTLSLEGRPSVLVPFDHPQLTQSQCSQWEEGAETSVIRCDASNSKECVWDLKLMPPFRAASGTGSRWGCHSKAQGHGGGVTPGHRFMVGVSVWAQGHSGAVTPRHGVMVGVSVWAQGHSGALTPGQGSQWGCHSQAWGHGGGVTPRHGVTVGLSLSGMGSWWGCQSGHGK